MREVRVGCAGWAYPDWRGVLYPEGMPQREWLSAYAREFDTVEVNNTFYRLPSADAVRGWVDETPADFRFAVKASRYITHVKRLLKPEKYVERFLGASTPCGSRASSASSSGSFRPISSATTIASPGRLRRSARGLPDGIASSSATRAGSRRTSTTCSAPTMRLW